MDEVVLRALNGLSRIPLVADLATFLSSPWMALATTSPVMLFLIRARRPFAIASIALAMGASDALNARVVKPLVGRERPCRALVGLERPAKCGVGESFASGHAAVAFAFATAASPVVPFGWGVFPGLAALVGGSRIVLGVHYPTDVVAGAILGSAIGAAFSRARRRLELRDEDQKAQSPSP